MSAKRPESLLQYKCTKRFLVCLFLFYETQGIYQKSPDSLQKSVMHFLEGMLRWIFSYSSQKLQYTCFVNKNLGFPGVQFSLPPSLFLIIKYYSIILQLKIFIVHFFNLFSQINCC